MKKLFNRLRNDRCFPLRKVLIFFWLVSACNIFISTAFKNSHPDALEKGEVTSGNSFDTSLMEALLYSVFSIVNSNGDLTDTVEDASEKLEFDIFGVFYFDTDQLVKEISFVLQHESIPSSDLEKFTPPPKLA